jgi:hypothetical protein
VKDCPTRLCANACGKKAFRIGIAFWLMNGKEVVTHDNVLHYVPRYAAIGSSKRNLPGARRMWRPLARPACSRD